MTVFVYRFSVSTKFHIIDSLINCYNYITVLVIRKSMDLLHNLYSRSDKDRHRHQSLEYLSISVQFVDKSTLDRRPLSDLQVAIDMVDLQFQRAAAIQTVLRRPNGRVPHSNRDSLRFRLWCLESYLSIHLIKLKKKLFSIFISHRLLWTLCIIYTDTIKNTCLNFIQWWNEKIFLFEQQRIGVQCSHYTFRISNQFYTTIKENFSIGIKDCDFSGKYIYVGQKNKSYWKEHRELIRKQFTQFCLYTLRFDNDAGMYSVTIYMV